MTDAAPELQPIQRRRQGLRASRRPPMWWVGEACAGCLGEVTGVVCGDCRTALGSDWVRVRYLLRRMQRCTSRSALVRWAVDRLFAPACLEALAPLRATPEVLRRWMVVETAPDRAIMLLARALVHERASWSARRAMMDRAAAREGAQELAWRSSDSA